MAEIYGPRRIYAPRAHDGACRWLSEDPALLDSLTGSQMGILGEMPLVCSAGFGAPVAVELMREAGLNPAPHRHEYRAGEAASKAMEIAQSNGAKLVVQHAYPPELLPASMQWIEPGLLCYLNNKASLCELTEPENLPPRQIACRACFFASAPGVLPVVLKAVTEQSTGGGVGVRICRTREDLALAAQWFAGCRHVVVEEFLPMARNVCLHFAVMPDATVKYLGYADQDVTAEGRYLGNWIEPGAKLDDRVIETAREVVRRGGAMGYRGIAGIDMAVLEDGRIVVVDLNFRVNGSTAAVLLSESILRARGAAVMHLRGFKGRGTHDDLIKAARPAVRSGTLIPLSFFDPIAAGHKPQPPRMQAMVLGNSKKEAAAIESGLAETGMA